MSAAAASFDEAAARRVLLVQAFDSAAGDAQPWSSDDARWATRLARESVAAAAPPATFIDARAQHALQRLAPRVPAIDPLLQQRGWRAGWLLLALVIGLAAGVAVDAVGSSQRINLLAPPVWAVLAWNLAVYLLLLLPAPLGLQRVLASRLAGPGGALRGDAAQPGPLLQFRSDWLVRARPLLLARAALLLHAAAAALALGLIAGLYLRGLVLDYRAGWESTFLDAAQVQSLLHTLLAPASAVTGIAVPSVDAVRALQVSPGVAPSATAAPWIHLYATMLALFVVVPRTLLAGWSAWRQSRRLTLALTAPYFQRLLRQRDTQRAQVQLLAHGAAPSPAARASIERLLADALGADLQLALAPATPYGNEESAAAIAAPPGATLRLLLVDLAATPEDDSHGAFVRALRQSTPAVPLLVLADEAAFKRRFATLPGRLDERRRAWRRWADALGVGLACVDLTQPDAAAARAAIEQAMPR